MDEEYRLIEQERNTLEHAIRREDEGYRIIEQERNTLEHAVRRENNEYRLIEQERNTLEHALRREDNEYRHNEQERNTLEHAIRREDEHYRQRERARDALQHSQRRENFEQRVLEQVRNTREHAERREDSQYREAERQRDAISHRIRRSNLVYRTLEQNTNTTRRRSARLNIDYRTIEQTRDTTQRREARQLARIQEHDLNRLRNCRVRLHRTNTDNRTRGNARQAARNIQMRENMSPESRIEHLTLDSQRHIDRTLQDFNRNIKNGPTDICVCCGGLWFPNQIKLLNRDVFLRRFSNLSEVFFLSEEFPSDSNIYKFCNTCYKVANSGKVPTICLSKGLHFPKIPDELKDLTPLEERFVAPRIPFMRIVSLGYNRQCAIRGAVVNVPISLDRTVDVLPRTFDQTEVIQVHLKRRLEFNHSFMTETIRPGQILSAARYLVNTELYRAHGVTISEQWLNSIGPNEEVPFISNTGDQELVQRLIQDNFDADDVTELNPQETLIDNDPIENMPLSRIAIAPGEGQRPLDLILDKDSEELSFPSIYCGVKRTCTATIGKVIRSEARRYDRRCARVDKVLYSYKKLELSKLKSNISTCLRKKIGHSSYTARDVLDDNFVQNLIQHDEGYHILKGIRSSPAHWEGEKKKVLAMIRQFGLPTFFITLSAAESQWPELLVILAKIVENKTISEEEAINYTTQQKYNLIRLDPITCSRYFDQRIRHLFKHFKVNGGVFDEYKVIKFYWRIEFQQRGSPHVHGIYWIENSPQLNISDQNSFPAVINFIDRFICTDSTIDDVKDYITYQQHNHSRSCQREIRGKKFCRFGIPHPPLLNTEILLPLPEDISPDETRRHINNFENIQDLLNAKLTCLEEEELNSLERFLSDERINISHEDYILALRSSLKQPKIFLKRSFKDRHINAFNSKILSMQRANMDIQFVMDAYACVSYIVNYINKSNRGVSRILQEVMEEIRAGNLSIKQRLQHIGNKFISASEVSAQEASYNILGMHLSQCSSLEVYINTYVPEKRVRMLKSRTELERISSESTDIFQSNILDHYVQRPDVLSDICLAYFAAYYKFSKSIRNTRYQEGEDDYIEDDIEITDEVGIPLRLRNNSGYVSKRKHAAIIRFPSFNADVTRSDYFRSLAMLYLPWRNEREELLDNNNEETCNIHKVTIEQNRVQFEIFKEGELEEIIQQVHSEVNDIENNLNDNTAATQLLDDEFRALAVPEIDNNVNIINIENNIHNDSIDHNQDILLIRLPPLISEMDLQTSIRSLNCKQRMYLQHLLQNVVESVCFYEYIGGGAGVGKSRLIKTIYQSVTHRLNSIPGANPDLPKVLLTAPTGKAAFGIGGYTLHSLFSLPINQFSGDVRPLSSDMVNTLVAKFMHLKVIIIDEISMVGSRMLGYLDSRLKQIFKTTQPFGGMSILVFGDLKQLPPVGDKWIFSSNSSNPYGTIAGGALWDLFRFYELTEIMRQREDLSFAQALNNMAVGQMTTENIELIQSRVVNSSDNIPSDAIHLFVSNAEAELHNALRLSRITTEEFTSKSFDIVKSDCLSAQRKRSLLNSVHFRQMKTSETQGLCFELKLKTTAKYMMTVNINTNDGLVNGASGVLMEIDFQGESRNPTTLWVLFSDENVGVEARRKKPHATESLWTPIEKCVRTFQYKQNRQITIERKQFPLVVAEGITIHKSQGATYSKVVVHTRGRMLRSALYVACSRATTASGLYIMENFNPPRPFEDSDPVKLELERLRTEKMLQLKHQFMINDEFELKIFYQNIQSLQAHYLDITTDNTILNCDIICFVETWSFPEEVYTIPGFLVLCRLDCNIKGDERNRNRKDFFG
ncbi:uncharacterized protein LOC119603786 [Lucilia sericata]|uniref:uncharacterized protein LOC119603786 n=1 Tax=Lucilia sericata TaxID=13632 RepID=UPI0018A861FD|nr:uncharacterized protein LOC119603786 [Lucilia sericata]